MNQQARSRLGALQAELFAGLVRGEAAASTTGIDPQLLSGIVRKHHAENVEKKLETFFPVFFRWARLDRAFVLKHFLANKTTGPARAVIDHLFRAAHAAVADLEHAAIWRELLVFERAERIAERNRLPATAQYVAALRAMTEDEAQGEVGPFVFARTRTNLIDIYHAYDPRTATDLGFERRVAFWCPPGAGRAEARAHTQLRRLAIEVAFV